MNVRYNLLASRLSKQLLSEETIKSNKDYERALKIAINLLEK